jgi:hypothetical protein
MRVNGSISFRLGHLFAFEVTFVLVFKKVNVTLNYISKRASKTVVRRCPEAELVKGGICMCWFVGSQSGITRIGLAE